MPITIVTGGQFGSEGKGKVACFLAKKQHASYAIRCGGSNSGHTVIDSSGKKNVFRQLPTATILPKIKLVLCAGCYINLSVLLEEISQINLPQERLLINPNAIIISQEDELQESSLGLINKIGSTGSGTGVAVANRVLRSQKTIQAKDIEKLQPYICDTTTILREALNNKERILIEGTQGFGLSLYHSSYFPYCTSRDTTAAGFLSEAGLSPLDVDDIALVIRAFPIRVAGNSGSLPYEIDWDLLTQEGGFDKKIIEYTTVTQKIRRVARFDPTIVNEAIKYNNPTKIFLNHVDYYDKNINEANLSIAKKYIEKIEKIITKKINYFGISPDSIIKL